MVRETLGSVNPKVSNESHYYIPFVKTCVTWPEVMLCYYCTTLMDQTLSLQTEGIAEAEEAGEAEPAHMCCVDFSQEKLLLFPRGM